MCKYFYYYRQQHITERVFSYNLGDDTGRSNSQVTSCAICEIIPTADERVGVQVKLWNHLRTRAIPEHLCSGDSLRRGAISSVYSLTFTFTYTDQHSPYLRPSAAPPSHQLPTGVASLRKSQWKLQSESSQHRRAAITINCCQHQHSATKLHLSGFLAFHVWLGAPAVGCRNCGLQVQILAAQLSSATLGKLLTHMCLCHHAV